MIGILYGARANEKIEVYSEIKRRKTLRMHTGERVRHCHLYVLQYPANTVPFNDNDHSYIMFFPDNSGFN